MINSTHDIHIDGTSIDQETLSKVFGFNTNDTFTRWVLSPLALLAGIGMGMIALVAGAFILMLSLATMPLLGLAAWVLKHKLERDLAATDPVVETQG